VLFTNRKLHTNFRLVLKVVTLDDLERRNAVISCYFTQFASFVASYVTVVEDRPILSCL